MENKDYTGLVPEQFTGKSFIAASETKFGSTEDATGFYETAKSRLLNVNDWGRICGDLSADFVLTDNNGQKVERHPREGDHFRIDIPGPGSEAGGGYDWVRVEAVKEVNEGDVLSIGLRVRPASNPITQSPHVAHFFSPESTSTFVVTKKGDKVSAAVYDRNIDANENATLDDDRVRNAVVGISAKYVAAKMQWELLTDALVKR